MRRDTRAMQNIKRMCTGLNICPADVLHKSTPVMRIYRDVIWMTAQRAENMKDEAAGFMGESRLDTALTYLMEFAPTEQKQDFESKVTSLFETKWMVDLIDTAFARVLDYPNCGRLYYEILSMNYKTTIRYTESQMLELLNLERSTYYERKREAVMLFGVALWGFAIPGIKNMLIEQQQIAAVLH